MNECSPLIAGYRFRYLRLCEAFLLGGDSPLVRWVSFSIPLLGVAVFSIYAGYRFQYPCFGVVLSLSVGYRFRYPCLFVCVLLVGGYCFRYPCLRWHLLLDRIASPLYDGYYFRYPCLDKCIPLVFWVSFSIPMFEVWYFI